MIPAAWNLAVSSLTASWTDSLWRATWQGGLLAIVVWGICCAWRKMPSQLVCALWWLVCLKLLLGLSPVSVTVPVLNSPPRTEAAAAPDVSYPVMTTQWQANPGRSLRHGSAAAETVSRRAAMLAAGTRWLLCAWFAGVLWRTTAALRSLLRLRGLIRLANPPTDPSLAGIASEAARAVGLKRVPDLLVSVADVQVFTIGWIRPVVVISTATIASNAPSDLRLILAHEFVHVRSGDSWFGIIPFLAQSLFWFHPAAWLACREYALAREHGCDAAAVSAIAAPLDAYARLLIRLGARNESSPSAFTLYVSSHFRDLKRRISMLEQCSTNPMRRPVRRAIVMAVFFGAIAIVPWRVVRAQNPAAPGSGGTPTGQIETGHRASANAVLPGSRAGKSETATKGQMGAYKRGSSVPSMGIGGAELRSAAKKPGGAAGTSGQSAKAAAGRSATMGIGSMGAYKESAPGAKTAVRGKEANGPLDITIYNLDFIEAKEAAAALTELFGSSPDRNMTIHADPRTNSIIVRATAAQKEQIQRVLTQLDRETVPPKEQALLVRIVPLKFARASEVAGTLNELFDGGSGKPIKILADQRTNSIVIQTDSEKFRKIEQVVNELDAQK